MKIYFPWFEWAYSHIASKIASNNINTKLEEIIWVPTFEWVWEKIWEWNIGILPIENSYAWSVHQNLYNFLRYDYKVIWEITTTINHCLLSKEKNIKKIHTIYSHPQAISQCYNFLKKHNIKALPYWDTAWAAKMISESLETWIGAIASTQAGKLYWLNILQESLQDQNWNSTRFFVVTKKLSKTIYKEKKSKTTIIFETKNIPASLYKCLWWFATNWVNLTKIESLPTLKNPFTYLFWLDFQWNLSDEKVKKSMDELKFFTKSIQILWTY